MKPYKKIVKKRLGQMLLENGIITSQELEDALKEHQKHKGEGRLFGETLVSLGFASEDEITAAISAQYGIPCLLLEQYEIPPSIIRIVPEEVARKHRCIPLDRMGDMLTLAIVNPLNDEVRKEIEEKTGLTVRCFIVTPRDGVAAIEKNYRAALAAEPVIPPEPREEEEEISTFAIRDDGTVEEAD